MTWAMISKQNELNEITIAYSEQKNQIAREFEEIKNEVTIEPKSIRKYNTLLVTKIYFRSRALYKLI